MKKILLTAVCATVLTFGALSVQAQGAPEDMPLPPPEHEMAMEKIHQKMEEKHEEMSKKLAEDLGLSDEQKTQAEKIRKDGHAKMKPLMEERKALHEKMDTLRKANMEEFEKILTQEQKKKFEQIKAKHKNHKGPKFGHGFGRHGGMIKHDHEPLSQKTEE